MYMYKHKKRQMLSVKRSRLKQKKHFKFLRFVDKSAKTRVKFIRAVKLSKFFFGIDIAYLTVT